MLVDFLRVEDSTVLGCARGAFRKILRNYTERTDKTSRPKSSLEKLENDGTKKR